jgi:hypothetical protein
MILNILLCTCKTHLLYFLNFINWNVKLELLLSYLVLNLVSTVVILLFSIDNTIWHLTYKQINSVGWCEEQDKWSSVKVNQCYSGWYQQKPGVLFFRSFPVPMKSSHSSPQLYNIYLLTNIHNLSSLLSLKLMDANGRRHNYIRCHIRMTGLIQFACDTHAHFTFCVPSISSLEPDSFSSSLYF